MSETEEGKRQEFLNELWDKTKIYVSPSALNNYIRLLKKTCKNSINTARE